MNAEEWPLALNIGLFVAAGVIVWFAGSRLARFADAFAEKAGIGRVALGMILLGGVTSLPEITIATTSTLQGTPLLAITDVLGSAALNVVILAVADATFGRGALTSIQGSSRVMMQGVLGIVSFHRAELLLVQRHEPIDEHAHSRGQLAAIGV